MIGKNLRWMASILAASNLILASPSVMFGDGLHGGFHDPAAAFQTATPLKHVIVIFQENISFDHYFATYPHAVNPEGETPFFARPNTPRVNNLLGGGLLTENPNSTQPFRMDTGVASVTCDMNHSYTPEQMADDHGLMDAFPANTGSAAASSTPACNDYGKGTGDVMGYFDGNTVTAIWNYAQHFALSDNSFSTMFGPSTVGAINLIAGTTEGATMQPLKVNGKAAAPSGNIANGQLSGPLLGDVRPLGDECVLTDPGLQGANLVSFSGKNVGDLLNAKQITWGWFQGGFAPTAFDAKGRAICGAHHAGLAGDDGTNPQNSSDGDYIPHHEPFQFFAGTENPHHVLPSDPSLIGTSSDGTNHQYDLGALIKAFGEVQDVFDFGGIERVALREPSGAEHVEFLAFGDEAVPDVFVEAVGETDRVEHGVAVSDLEQEGNHAEVQIEIGDERAMIGPAAETATGVQDHGGSAVAGFGGEETVHGVGGVEGEGFAGEDLGDCGHGFRQMPAVDGDGDELADAGAHDVEQNLGIAGVADGYDLGSDSRAID